MKRHIGLGWLAAGTVLLAANQASAQTEIQWWHAMTGADNPLHVLIARSVDRRQEDYKVVPTF